MVLPSQVQELNVEQSPTTEIKPLRHMLDAPSFHDPVRWFRRSLPEGPETATSGSGGCVLVFARGTGATNSTMTIFRVSKLRGRRSGNFPPCQSQKTFHVCGVSESFDADNLLLWVYDKHAGD